MLYRQLTNQETAALVDFAVAHGRKWKSKLTMEYWYNARIWDGRHVLHGLRNEFGPKWLAQYKLPTELTRVRCFNDKWVVEVLSPVKGVGWIVQGEHLTKHLTKEAADTDRTNWF